jgi:hypothetical protein
MEYSRIECAIRCTRARSGSNCDGRIAFTRPRRSDITSFPMSSSRTDDPLRWIRSTANAMRHALTAFGNAHAPSRQARGAMRKTKTGPRQAELVMR